MAKSARSTAVNARGLEASTLRATEWLSSKASPRVWRDVLACAVGVLTVASISGGLVLYLSWLQLGLVGGVAVGLVAASLWSAGLIGGAASLVAVLVGPQSLYLAPTLTPALRMQHALGTAAVAAGVAVGIAYLVRKAPRSARWAFWLVVAVILGNLLVTMNTVSRAGTFDPVSQLAMPSLREQIDGAVPPNSGRSDHRFFWGVAQKAAAGEPFYEAFTQGFVEWGGRPPSSVTNIRFPLLFYIWGVLGPGRVLGAYVLLAAATIVLSTLAVSSLVKLPLTLPACAALSSYLMYFSMSLALFTGEAWAICVALMSVAAYIRSLESARWGAWLVASAAAAVLAALLRETLIFLPLAGVVAAAMSQPSQRRFRLLVWGLGVATVVIAFGLHYANARAYLVADSTYSQFAAGSFANLLAGLKHATDYLGYGGWFALTLAVLGLVGMAFIPDRGLRVYVTVATWLPLLSFLAVKNTAVNVFRGTAINYWGAAVVPLIYLSISFIFLVVPGASRKNR